jgi:hypothetical protein
MMNMLVMMIVIAITMMMIHLHMMILLKYYENTLRSLGRVELKMKSLMLKMIHS